ncbi:MAG: UDP-N-acetylmuramoyl-tripeptide--D-alanyl-D-alanine ligase [Deferrisomatales bacterium]
MRFALDAVLRATAAAPAPGPRAPTAFDGVSTDTRTLRPGQLFVALEGPRFDGHDFLADARLRGAGAALVHRPVVVEGLPCLQVRDTLEALGALGRCARDRLRGPVVGITGSVGKTTTKEMAAALLEEAGLRVLRTPGNWNNRVGLPLTLLQARGDEDAAVLELGVSEPGEMAHLAAVCAPDMAVVTAVAEAHTEGLGALRDVAREKLAIVQGLRPGGTLVLPFGDPLLLPPAGVRVATFGWEAGADLRGEGWTARGPEGSRFAVGGRSVEVSLPGRHNATNALAALAAVAAAGIAWGPAVPALARLRPAPLRGEVRTTGGGVHLVVDCYNANPAAVEAALATLGELAGRARKVAVLGAMRELGPQAPEAHARVGRSAAAGGVDELHLLGPEGAWIREGAAGVGLPAEQIWVYDDREALAAALARRLRPGDWVLIKGSRALGLEAVVDRLEEYCGP